MSLTLRPAGHHGCGGRITLAIHLRLRSRAAFRRRRGAYVAAAERIVQGHAATILG